MLGSHTGGLLGSSQPFIHVHLLAATNIAAKANVGGTAERNHLSKLEICNVTHPNEAPCLIHSLRQVDPT